MWVYYICFLLCWGYFYSCFWRVFIITGCWILSKAFSASTEIIIWFLSFKLLMWCITLIDLWILKNPCIPEIKPTWSWCMTFLICCWILFARILLGIFATMSISDIGLQFSFFFFPFFFFFWWHVCLALVLVWWRPHRTRWEFILLCNFLEEFEQIGVSSSLNFW